MHKVIVGKLGDYDLTYCQYANLDEAKKADLPNGTHFFWEYKGQRIYSPGEIVQLVIEHAQSGQLQSSDFTTHQNIQKYYKGLFESQKKSALEQMGKVKQGMEAMTDIPDEIKKVSIENLDNTIKIYQDSDMFPDIDGIFRPKRETAEKLVGGKENLNKMLTPEQQRNLFGE